MSFKEKTQSQEHILELYDGQIAKSSNKKLISDNIPPLKITARGKELFALSESFYGKWLEEGGDYKLVERATEMCAEAVKTGYPHAVVRMGYYYDKDYLAVDRTEEFRCRVACDYYCKVVYSDAPPVVEDGVTPEIGWEELQKRAAYMLLDMLAAAKKGLMASSEKYSFGFNLENVRQRLNLPVSHIRQRPREERDREKFAQTIFESCKTNKTRAPLFGIICLKRAEAQRLFAHKSAVMKLCGDINIWLCSGDKIFKANNTGAFTQFLSGLDSENVWVYFFNNNLGGHRYLSGKQRKALCDLMMKDGFRRFNELKKSALDKDKSVYLFSDDDIQFFITGAFTSMQAALDNLINTVISDNGWGNL